MDSCLHSGLRLHRPLLRRLDAIEIILELKENGIFDSLLDVEGHREDQKRVSADCIVVPAHVIEEGVLVAEVEVILQLRVDFEVV